MEFKEKSGPEYQDTQKQSNYEDDFAACRCVSYQLGEQICEKEKLELEKDPDRQRLQHDLPMTAVCVLLEKYAEYLSDKSSDSPAQSDVPSPDEVLEEDWAMEFLDEINEHRKKFQDDFELGLYNNAFDKDALDAIVGALSHTATILSLSMYFDHLPRFEYEDSSLPEKEKSYADDIKRRLPKVNCKNTGTHHNLSHGEKAALAETSLNSSIEQTSTDPSDDFDPRS